MYKLVFTISLLLYAVPANAADPLTPGEIIAGGEVPIEFHDPEQGTHRRIEGQHFFLHHGDAEKPNKLEVTGWMRKEFFSAHVPARVLTNLRTIAEAKKSQGELFAVRDAKGNERVAEFRRVIASPDPDAPGKIEYSAVFQYATIIDGRARQETVSVPLETAALESADLRASFQRGADNPLAIEVAPNEFVPVKLLGFSVGHKQRKEPVFVKSIDVDSEGQFDRNSAMYRVKDATLLVTPGESAEVVDASLPHIIQWDNFIGRESNLTAESQIYTERQLASKLFLTEFGGRIETVILLVSNPDGSERFSSTGAVVLNPLARQPYFLSNHLLTHDWMKITEPEVGHRHLMEVPSHVAAGLIKIPPSRRIATANDLGTTSTGIARIYLRGAFVPSNTMEIDFSPRIKITGGDVQVSNWKPAQPALTKIPFKEVQNPIDFGELISSEQRFLVSSEYAVANVLILAVHKPNPYRPAEYLCVSRADVEQRELTSRVYWLSEFQITRAFGNTEHLNPNLLISDVFPNASPGSTELMIVRESAKQTFTQQFEMMVQQGEVLRQRRAKRTSIASFRRAIRAPFNRDFWRWRTQSLGTSCPVAFADSLRMMIRGQN